MKPSKKDQGRVVIVSSRTVALPSGGSLKLSSTQDFFKLDRNDRNFVSGLLDRMDEYCAHRRKE